MKLLGALEGLRKDLEAAENMYYFALDVEEQIENNIFLINYKNKSFTEDYLAEYHSLSKEFQEMYQGYFKHAQNKAVKLELI
jgi:hypothetical protein